MGKILDILFEIFKTFIRVTSFTQKREKSVFLVVPSHFQHLRRGQTGVPVQLSAVVCRSRSSFVFEVPTALNVLVSRF
jgi:hypothetical protein